MTQEYLLPLNSGNLANWTDFCTEKDFWTIFFKDLEKCISSLEIVSPFIKRVTRTDLKEKFERLRQRSVKITVYSRPVRKYNQECNVALKEFEQLNIEIKRIEKIHHKIAIIDNAIWWEGSLNILSFNETGEHMRRFEGPEAKLLLQTIGLTEDAQPLL
jgi:hypothetical protein